MDYNALKTTVQQQSLELIELRKLLSDKTSNNKTISINKIRISTPYNNNGEESGGAFVARFEIALRNSEAEQGGTFSGEQKIDGFATRGLDGKVSNWAVDFIKNLKTDEQKNDWNGFKKAFIDKYMPKTKLMAMEDKLLDDSKLDITIVPILEAVEKLKCEFEDTVPTLASLEHSEELYIRGWLKKLPLALRQDAQNHDFKEGKDKLTQVLEYTVQQAPMYQSDWLLFRKENQAKVSTSSSGVGQVHPRDISDTKDDQRDTKRRKITRVVFKYALLARKCSWCKQDFDPSHKPRCNNEYKFMSDEDAKDWLNANTKRSNSYGR